ncbi:MAG: hypothetical protein RR034_05650 [Bacteroidales bacterium]
MSIFLKHLIMGMDKLKAIRCHWGVENKLHWFLDNVFNEENSSKRAGFSIQNFSTINKIIINILRKDKEVLYHGQKVSYEKQA